MSLEPRSIPVPEYRANIGAPMARRREQKISSTILGLEGGPLVCPREYRLAIDFSGREPVSTMRSLLRAVGLDSPEQLRPFFGLRLRPLACLSTSDITPLQIGLADDQEVLRQAFLLGLCTMVMLDPMRPVLWTQSSLTRRLALFDLEGFYA